MYRECEKCGKKTVKNMKSNVKTYYYKWVTSKERRIGQNNKVFDVTVTSKTKISCTISEMIQELNSSI